jgi:hypothetical protein
MSGLPSVWSCIAQKTRSPDWACLKKPSARSDDADLKEAIAVVAKNYISCYCIRVMARLKIIGRDINSNRVYRFIYDGGVVAVQTQQNLFGGQKA